MLENTAVKVFELMPLLVDTEFSAAIGGAQHGIPPKRVADDMLSAMEHNEYEIHVGGTADFHSRFFSDTTKGVLALNGKL